MYWRLLVLVDSPWVHVFLVAAIYDNVDTLLDLECHLRRLTYITDPLECGHVHLANP